jgi:hypothetical protein
MVNLDDEWVAAHSPIIAQKLHALGVVTLEWNKCETALVWLFNFVVGLPAQECWALFYEMGDIAISERLKSLIKIKKFHPDTIAILENALKLYEGCRLNRNQLTHFQVMHYPNDILLVRKSKKADAPQHEYFPNTLSDVRRVADEIIVLERRLWILSAFLEDYGPKKPAPWPPKLTPPKLLWSPLPKKQPKQPRQPRSSRP